VPIRYALFLSATTRCCHHAPYPGFWIAFLYHLPPPVHTAHNHTGSLPAAARPFACTTLPPRCHALPPPPTRLPHCRAAPFPLPHHALPTPLHFHCILPLPAPAATLPFLPPYILPITRLDCFTGLPRADNPTDYTVLTYYLCHCYPCVRDTSIPIIVCHYHYHYCPIVH